MHPIPTKIVGFEKSPHQIARIPSSYSILLIFSHYYELNEIFSSIKLKYHYKIYLFSLKKSIFAIESIHQNVCNLKNYGLFQVLLYLNMSIRAVSQNLMLMKHLTAIFRFI